ncbi:MAG: hypothetical protein JJE46_16240 [Acidimicrobiia bacterium]|nr:hypothetical protein [Acidimicrobiia bacterium]
MSVLALTNERWGFASNCYACEPTNDTGLRIPFFHDTDAGIVFAEFNLDGRFSGAPAYLHGGITLTVLDEAMAWAAIAVAGQWAVTHTTSTTFDRPIKVGSTYRVEARIDQVEPDAIEASAIVTGAGGTTRARARATFVPLGAAQAVDAIGTVPEGPDTTFFRSK